MNPLPGNALTVERLVVSMGAQQILHEVSVTVPERGIVTVLGANGVGKTTLMRTISGVYRARSGRVVFQGQDITEQPSHRIVALGLAQAPEGRQVFAAMSVRENLLLGGAMLSREDFETTFAEVLDRFPVLRQRLAQQAGSLSGGEQQMLCIGRALMSRPRLLLLDEPSLGLAPKIVRQIFELVSSIRAAGTAILLVEQNVRQALKVADHGYVMEGGRIVLEGPAAELRDDPRVRDAYLGGA
ncbi:MAG: ABC transporter ATP-binding protein [Burkholderiales bacterium]|jgi:branched-chain amino acid transport system ATP-binding protein